MISTALLAGLVELGRTRARSLTAAATLSVLAFLTLTLTGLADGLDRGSTGVLRALDADVVVFNEEARRQVLRSRLPQPMTATLPFRVEGVQAVGTVGLVPTSVRIGAEESRATLVGYNARTPAEPTGVVEGRLPVDGEPGIAALDVSLRASGVALGDTVVVAGDREFEVVGFLDDARFLQQPTIWVPPDEWARVRTRAFPEAGWAESLAGVTVVRTEGGQSTATVASAIAQELDGVEAVGRRAAITSIPGVDVQRTTFVTIVAMTVVIVGVVVSLLFALVVDERRGQLARLRALGASARMLRQALLAQVVALWAVALVVATAATGALTRAAPQAMPLALRPVVVAAVGLLLLAASLTGGAVALRRLVRIDPAAAMEEDT